MAEQEQKPSPALDGKYKVVGVVPGEVYVPGTGRVDLRTISLAEADELMKAGFPYLEKVEAKASKSGDDPAPAPRK